MIDRFDPQMAGSAGGVLRRFNAAGVLAAADVHVAVTLGRLAGETDDAVLLAAALAARGPRLGHVCVDLTTVARTAQSERDETADLADLPWPDPDGWIGAVRISALTGVEGPDAPGGRPLRLAGPDLYLDRYWRQERAVAVDLLARSCPAAGVDRDLLRDGLQRLFPDDPDQRIAGAVAALRRLTVVAGGPGTGKTTTVARILALLDEQSRAAGGGSPKVALVAPTGKAAARLEQSVRWVAATLDTTAASRSALAEVQASTIHRLLGWRPDSSSRFRHDRTNRLAVDVVVVDETSMVSLTLMARLLEAVRADTRLILVGDPDQLSSVEAGAVLADVVGPAALHPRHSGPMRAAVAEVTGLPADPIDDPAPDHHAAIGDGIVVLRRVHRFGGGIGRLANAIQAGDAPLALELLGAGGDGVEWHPGGDPETVRDDVATAAAQVVTLARSGDAGAALSALGSWRVLCANRSGPQGVEAWNERIGRWVAQRIDDYGAGGAWYAGRPLLITRNDYGLGLYNGDVGVVIAGARGPAVAFDRSGTVVTVAPTRIDAAETVHAMTVHKGQGSQFDSVVVVLPDPDARILTRELLYTAVTRARRRVVVLGAAASVRAALERPVARASGLGRRLWGQAGSES